MSHFPLGQLAKNQNREEGLWQFDGPEVSAQRSNDTRDYVHTNKTKINSTYYLVEEVLGTSEEGVLDAQQEHPEKPSTEILLTT